MVIALIRKFASVVLAHCQLLTDVKLVGDAQLDLPGLSRKLGAKHTDSAEAVILDVGELAILLSNFRTLASSIE